ncbi:MAG: hypothetical protein JXR96_30900 [Deltaproteobacteria bacterium]|nr:hypothetical protein [Deltaproteobacteria bacterium]
MRQRLTRIGWLVGLASAALALAACEGQPKAPAVELSQPVDLPEDELRELQERIKSSLLEIQDRCQAHRITAEQIRQAMYACDWDDPQADLLSQMPIEIRAQMRALRDDIVRHNAILVDAYETAMGVSPEGREQSRAPSSAEEVSP